VRDDAVFEYDTGSDIEIDDLLSASMLSEEDYVELKEDGRTPYPNNFDLCSVRYADTADVKGDVPDDKAVTDCIYNGLIGASNCSNPGNLYDVMIVASIDGTYAGTVATHQSHAMPSERNTEELRTAAYDFFRTHYGFDFDPANAGFQSVMDGNGAPLVSVAQSQLAVPYRVNAIDDQTGSTPFSNRMQTTNVEIDDVIFAVIVHQNIDPLPAHSVDFGVDSLSVGQTVVYGNYRFLIDGVYDEQVMPDIIYHTSYGEKITMGSTFTFFCAVEHPYFGKGQVNGVQTATDNDDGTFTIRTSAVHTYPATLNEAAGKYTDSQCRDL